MEVIANLNKEGVGASILRLHRDMSRMETLINEIESNNLSVDRKLSKAEELTTKLKVYDYISKQLLNIAEKWCADHHSPVYWAVMQNKMKTCNACNAGQGICTSAFYSIAQGLNANEVVYDFCNDCQSVYSVEESVCSSCDTCEGCNSCQGGNNGDSRPNTCYSCYSSCQGCNSCQSCDTCQGCFTGQSCGSGWSTYGACESCNGYYSPSSSSSGDICGSSFSYCYQNQ